MFRSTVNIHPKAFAVLVVTSMLIGGCTSAVTLRNDMQEAKVAYTTCLTKNPGNPKACQTEKMVFDADVEAYSTINKSTPVMN